MGFILGAVLLTVAVLAILSLPWWRRSANRGRPLSADQMAAELNDDVATGLLAANDLEPASRDLEATAEPDVPQQPPMRQPRWQAVIALLLVPVIAGVLYAHFGNWRAALEGEHAATLHEAEMDVARLKAQAQANPNNADAWVDLGQGDEALGRYSAAAQAYQHAVGTESTPDADVLALWGEAALLADPHRITAKERQIFSEVLKLDPDNARGLWYGGLIALSDGKKAVAAADWQRLLKRPDIPAPVASLVRSHLAVLGASTATVTNPAGASIPAPRREISVTVSLGPRLVRQFSPGETLFVYARDPGGGPPVAVRKLNVSSFPITVVLDDRDAMVEGRDLSSTGGSLEIVARLSPSGKAMPQAGDLQAERRVTPAGTVQKVELVLNRVVGSGN